MTTGARRPARWPWAIVAGLLLVLGLAPSPPPADAAAPPSLRAVPWAGCEPPCSYLSGINGYENEVDKFRFRIEVASEHEPVTVEWSSPTLPDNPESGNLPADAFIDGVAVGVQETVTGGTTFEWNPGESRGSNEVNCYYPFTGSTSSGNCYWVSITATDAIGQATTVSVYLRVLEDINPPTVEIVDMSPPDATVAIGETITFTVVGTDTDIPTASSIEYSLWEEPGQESGATIDPTAGEFSWTPAEGQDGSYLMEILVREVDPDIPPNQLAGEFVEVPIVVGSGNRPPEVEVVTPVMNVAAGEVAETEFWYYDSDFTNQDLTASLAGAPAGSGLFPPDNPDTFAWPTSIDDDGKSFGFSLVVTDGVDTTTVPMTVNVGNVQTVQISITESVAVTDSVTVSGPVVIQISESVGVVDTAAVRPPVQISISETVGVVDDVTVSPPVQIIVNESIGVSDAVSVRPPVLIAISESVGVVDDVTVAPPTIIMIDESIGVTDALSIDVIPDPAGDDDGDGIANSVDTAPMVPSNELSDVPLGGTTYGTIIDRGSQIVTIVDASDPSVGVTVETVGPFDDFATIDVCSTRARVWGGTLAHFTCGSVRVEVVRGRVTLLTSDDALVDVPGGSEVVLVDDEANVRVDVIAGTATVTAGGREFPLSAGEVLENPGDPREPEPPPTATAPTTAAPITVSPVLPQTGSNSTGSLVLLATAVMLVGVGALTATRRRRRS